MCLRYIVFERGKIMKDGITRRKFVTTVAATGAGLTIVPRHVLGRGFQAPSDTVNIATVGIGGMGGSNTRNLMSQNIVAVCDVDWGYAEKRFDAYKTELQPAAGRDRAEPGAVEPSASDAVQGADGRRREAGGAGHQREPEALRRTSSSRRFSGTPITAQMLDKQKDIDGIVVATPDHMHAAIALAAMDVGKHVYVQKPLCWSVQEARRLAEKAKATQGRHPDGQPGSLHRRRPHGLRVHHRRRDRRRPRSARLDEPAARLLAAGHSSSGAAWPAGALTSRSRWNGPGVEARLAAAHGRQLSGAGRS